MKALIFPNDPLISYLKKGEIKERYFNPNNIFSQVYFITFTDRECSIDDIQKTIGNAKGKIYNLKKLTFLDLIYPQRRVKEILNITKNLDFDIIRCFNPLYQGYYGMILKNRLKKKLVISLHGNFDLDIRYQYRKNKDPRYFKYLYTKLFIEKKVLNSADAIIGAYNFAAKYAIDNGVEKNKVRVIYNRVDLSLFKPKTLKETRAIRVISVGRLIKEKGQRILIDAIPFVDKNVYFTFVGDGEDYNLLVSKVKKLNIQNRVKFIRSIPNSELAELYREHDIFALPIKYGGICIPALEATASGLALVMPKPIHEEKPEIIWRYAEVVDNNPISFAKGINKIARDFELRKKMVEKGLSVITSIDGKIMERKESELYREMIGR